MDEIDARILTKVRLYLEKLRKNGITICEAYIFGSYVKGKPDRWSDIDIAIVSPQIGEDRFEERVKLTQLAISVDDRLEPLPFNPETFLDEDPLVKKIKNEGLAVN